MLFVYCLHTNTVGNRINGTLQKRNQNKTDDLIIHLFSAIMNLFELKTRKFKEH